MTYNYIYADKLTKETNKKNQVWGKESFEPNYN